MNPDLGGGSGGGLCSGPVLEAPTLIVAALAASIAMPELVWSLHYVNCRLQILEYRALRREAERMSMNLPLLWHIPLSHFNEKVRWALDFKNIPHRRQRVGADYLFQAWRATGHGTLPILFLDGKPIRDSTAIIAALEQQHPEPALYPKDQGATSPCARVGGLF